MPTFSTCIMFEMRNVNNVPHIEIFLKNPSTPAVPLHIPKCGVSCPLHNFFVLYKDVLPTKSFQDECNRSSAHNNGKNY